MNFDRVEKDGVQGRHLLAMIPLVCYSIICMDRLTIHFRYSPVGYEESTFTKHTKLR